MDIIKAVESYPYYHSMTGQSREEWEAWRVQACEEWMLDKAILEKGEDVDGEADSDSKGCHGSAAGVGEQGLRRNQTAEQRTESARVHSNPWQGANSLL